MSDFGLTNRAITTFIAACVLGGCCLGSTITGLVAWLVTR